MTTLEHIAAFRTTGLVTAREEAWSYAEPEPFAASCGLYANPGIYRQISADEAIAVIKAILHQDMAYKAELMPHQQAEELAKSLLAEYAANSARYFTNGDFGKLGQDTNVVPGWNPATNATFDSGVLVLGIHKSRCLWVQDKD
jgi:hypothetical protein